MTEGEQLAERPRSGDPGVLWAPSERQEAFLACPARERLYGGAAGGGKTDALLMDAASLVTNPHHRGILFRRTKPELEQWVIPRAFDLYEALGGRWKGKNLEWHFDSGAIIRFGYAHLEASIRNYAGAPYNWIGFDELTSFTEWQYRFMLSRNRSAHGVPCYMAAGSNPGDVGHDFVLQRWAPWLYKPGLSPDYEGPYFPEGEVGWFLSGHDGTEHLVPPGTQFALSRTFIPSHVHDNPFLVADEQYLTALHNLPLLEREQLLRGNWMARGGKGWYFKSEWWIGHVVPMAPGGVIARLRYWDLASTPEKLAKPESAYTAGVLLSGILTGWDANGWPKLKVTIEDVIRERLSPLAVELAILETAKTDKMRDPKTVTVIERDPGQAGMYQAATIIQAAGGADVMMRAVPPNLDKVTRAKVPSSQVEAGFVDMVRARWNQAFIQEGQDFPEGYKDQIDAFSGGFVQLRLLAIQQAPPAPGRPTPGNTKALAREAARVPMPHARPPSKWR